MLRLHVCDTFRSSHFLLDKSSTVPVCSGHVPEKDVKKMVRTNPARLLGLNEADLDNIAQKHAAQALADGRPVSRLATTLSRDPLAALNVTGLTPSQVEKYRDSRLKCASNGINNSTK